MVERPGENVSDGGDTAHTAHTAHGPARTVGPAIIQHLQLQL